jgi:hypothetical protein
MLLRCYCVKSEGAGVAANFLDNNKNNVQQGEMKFKFHHYINIIASITSITSYVPML